MISLFGKDEDPPPSLLERLKQSVSKTRSEIAARVEGLFSGGRSSTPNSFGGWRTPCWPPTWACAPRANCSTPCARPRIASRCSDPADFRERAEGAPARDPERRSAHTQWQRRRERPRVIFVVGVNGTGKTTTIGKLAHRLHQEGASVLLGAGDTFRAAAIEQLGVWAERTGSEIIQQKPGADPGGRGLRRACRRHERATSTW